MRFRDSTFARSHSKSLQYCPVQIPHHGLHPLLGGLVFGYRVTQKIPQATDPPMTSDWFLRLSDADPAALCRTILDSVSDATKPILGREHLTLDVLMLLRG